MRNPLHHAALSIASRIWNAPRSVASAIIEFYQQTLSPDHGPLRHLYTYGYCRHSPTCSEYAKRKFAERGVVVGLVLSIGRLATCHPWRKPDDRKLEELSRYYHSSSNNT